MAIGRLAMPRWLEIFGIEKMDGWTSGGSFSETKSTAASGGGSDSGPVPCSSKLVADDGVGGEIAAGVKVDASNGSSDGNEVVQSGGQFVPGVPNADLEYGGTVVVPGCSSAVGGVAISLGL